MLIKLLENYSRILVYELGYLRGVEERLRKVLSKAPSLKKEPKSAHTRTLLNVIGTEN
jgi:hypothetical protein